MTREIAAQPGAVPDALASQVAGYSWSRDLVGEAGAAVHRLHAPERPDLYLKHGVGDVADSVADEAARMRWLAERFAVPKLTGFVRDGSGAWLLMSAIPGETAYQRLAAEPANRAVVVDALAAHLRLLHSLPVADCPFDSSHAVRMVAARRRIDCGLVDIDDFGAAHAGLTAEQVWETR